MNKKIKIIIKIILFNILPLLLIYLSHFDLFNIKKILIKNLNKTKNYIDILFFTTGLILQYLLVNFKWSLTKLANYNIMEERDSLLKFNKDNCLKVLEEQTGLDIVNHLNVRIFIPKHKTIYRLLGFLEIIPRIKFTKKYVIKNYNMLCNEGNTNNMEFNVYPIPQGIVGRCYKTGELCYDEFLGDKGYNYCKKEYNLTKYQYDKSFSTKFILGVPIKDNKEKVLAVVTFDSKKNGIYIEDDKSIEEAWRNMTVNFSYHLFQNAPKLFD